MRLARICLLGALCVGVIVGPLVAQHAAQENKSEQTTSAKHAKRRAMDDGYPEGPMWDVLDQLAGVWSVTEHHYNALGQIIATVEGTEEVVWVLDGYAIERSYTTKSGDELYKAVGTFVWNESAQAFEGVWFDNRNGGGATISKGVWKENPRMIHYKLEPASASSKSTKYEVLDRFLSKDTHEATTYTISGSDRLKRLVVHYKRSEPCGLNSVMSLFSITPTEENKATRK